MHTWGVCQKFSNITILSGVWDADLTCYSESAACLVCFSGLEHGFKIHGFRPTYLIIWFIAKFFLIICYVQLYAFQVSGNACVSTWATTLVELLQSYHIVKEKSVTLVEDDPKAPVSIATTPKCRGGQVLCSLGCSTLPYNFVCLARWHQVPFFESLVWLDQGLKSGLPHHWLTLYSLGQWPGSYDIIIIIIMSCCQHGYPWPSLHHFSLLFMASGRSSGLHPVSSHSCCMYVQTGHPAFARPYVGVHLWARPC